MRVLSYQIKDYDCRIWLNDKDKLILKIDCDCWNFVNRRIQRIGKVFLTKYKTSPCKHLKMPINALLKQGYNFKQITYDKGLDKITPKLKKQLLSLYKNQCATENCHNTNLEFHRIIPGYLGGKYNLTNVIVLCSACHKRRHSKEFT